MSAAPPPSSVTARFRSVGACGFLIALAAGAAAAEPGSTRIARWLDDKQAAFVLMFDDSTPSQVKHAVPELVQRGLVATFYVNPGKGEWQALRAAWEREIPAAGMEYGNHTMSHKGVSDLDHAEREIGGCNAIITELFPDRVPKLISFAKPGVPKEAWAITPEQMQTVLARHHLVERPPFRGHGAMIHHKTGEEMGRLVDQALANGDMGYIVYHGVGGDWISTPLSEFTAFLDHLVSQRERLWITGHAKAHAYVTERDSARVEVLESSPEAIRLALVCEADPAWYDQPLTLVTQVPDAWSDCVVVQGGRTAAATATDGRLRYQAVPGPEPVVLRPAGP